MDYYQQPAGQIHSGTELAKPHLRQPETRNLWRFGSWRSLYIDHLCACKQHYESPENSLQLHLYGKDYTVHTHSFLCYGKDQALWQKLAKDIQVSSAGILKDPCFNLGYEKVVNVSKLHGTPCNRRFEKKLPFDQFQIQGTGDYEQCHQSILKLINNSHCPYSQCAFNGVFLPPLHDSFGAFSAFYFVMDFFFKKMANDSIFSQEKMTEITKIFCSKPWQEVKTSYPTVKEKYLSDTASRVPTSFPCARL